MTDSEQSAEVAFAATAFFDRTFEEALALASDARDYLRNKGLADANDMAPEDGLTYSVESMRLTARVTQVMAWLLAQKAYANGELREAESAEMLRLGGQSVCSGDHASTEEDGLPEDLRILLDRSENIYARVARLDHMMLQQSEQNPPPNMPPAPEPTAAP